MSLCFLPFTILDEKCRYFVLFPLHYLIFLHSRFLSSLHPILSLPSSLSPFLCLSSTYHLSFHTLLLSLSLFHPLPRPPHLSLLTLPYLLPPSIHCHSCSSIIIFFMFHSFGFGLILLSSKSSPSLVLIYKCMVVYFHLFVFFIS